MAKTRIVGLILSVLLIVVGVTIQAGIPISEYAGRAWSSFYGPDRPLDLIIAVYESKNQPVGEASALCGQTANSLRKVNKWRQYDKDELPEAWKSILQPIVDKTGVPCLVFVRNGKVVAYEKGPSSDEALSAAIAKRGGV